VGGFPMMVLGKAVTQILSLREDCNPIPEIRQDGRYCNQTIIKPG
jgi:hypothetical protein